MDKYKRAQRDRWKKNKHKLKPFDWGGLTFKKLVGKCYLTDELIVDEAVKRVLAMMKI